MPKVISVFNQKGGVGKTTTNINLSTYVSLLGYKVLVVDADPQGNTTSGFGVDKAKLDNTLYDGMVNGVPGRDIIINTRFKNLKLIPADPDLAGAEIEISNLGQRELKIKKIIESIDTKYDFIFIDCPPSLGLISVNALAASHSVLIPIQCEYYALEGVSQLMNTVNLVKRGLNGKLDIEGILLTMYDGRTNLSLQVVDEVCRYFQDKVYRTIIPRNVRLAESPSHGLTIYEYDERSKGAESYMQLAREFIGKGKKNGK